MAQTTSAALKTKIESLGLSLAAYRDQASETATLPYVVIHEAISTTPDPLEDGQLTTGAEQVQVDLFEQLGSETYALAPGIAAGLHGQRLASIGSSPAKVVYVCLIRNRTRVVDLQFNQVRHIFDVDVLREL